MTEFVECLSDLKVSVTPVSNLTSKMGEFNTDAIEKWICVEENEAVQNALVEEDFCDIEDIFVEVNDVEHDETRDERIEEPTIRKPMKSVTKISSVLKVWRCMQQVLGKELLATPFPKRKWFCLVRFKDETKR